MDDGSVGPVLLQGMMMVERFICQTGSPAGTWESTTDDVNATIAIITVVELTVDVVLVNVVVVETVVVVLLAVVVELVVR